MKLKLIRKWKKETYTIGQLYVDGVFFSNTIEDKDRGLDQKMPKEQIFFIKKPGITAIPTGTYEITLSIQSNKYKKSKKIMEICNGYVPRLIDVPGYSGILIHPGNTAKDTEGCIIPGKNDKVGYVSNSTHYFTLLYNKMKDAKRKNEKITIEII